MKAAYAYGLSCGFLLLCLWPIWRGVDSFPLSNYPMFARAKPQQVKVSHVVGITKSGERVIVPPKLLGTDEVLQAKVLLDRTVRKGRKASRALCKRVSATIAEHESKPWKDLVRLEVRTDIFKVRTYFSEGPKAVRSRVHSRCAIGTDP